MSEGIKGVLIAAFGIVVIGGAFVAVAWLIKVVLVQ